MEVQMNKTLNFLEDYVLHEVSWNYMQVLVNI